MSLSEAGENMAPRSIRQMLKFLEQIGPENQLVVQGYARASGDGDFRRKAPNLPPSMLRLLANSRETGTSSTTETSLLFEKRKTMDRIVAGGQLVGLTLKDRGSQKSECKMQNAECKIKVPMSNDQLAGTALCDGL